jgi:hypothetical protein
MSFDENFAIYCFMDARWDEKIYYERLSQAV